MNERIEIYNKLSHDAPVQIIPAPENLFVECKDDGEVWYSPIVCMVLTKAHNIEFCDTDDFGEIDIISHRLIKKLNIQTGKIEAFHIDGKSKEDD